MLLYVLVVIFVLLLSMYVFCLFNRRKRTRERAKRTRQAALALISSCRTNRKALLKSINVFCYCEKLQEKEKGQTKGSKNIGQHKDTGDELKFVKCVGGQKCPYRGRICQPCCGVSDGALAAPFSCSFCTLDQQADNIPNRLRAQLCERPLSMALAASRPPSVSFPAPPSLPSAAAV